ncbi:MAG: sugar transferase [bacterium]
MPTAKKYAVYKYVLAGIDWVTIVAAYGVAFVFESRWLLDHQNFNQPVVYETIVFVTLVGAAAVFIFHYLGLYQIHVFVTVVHHLVQIIKGLAVLQIAIAVASFFTKANFIIDSRLLILYFAIWASLLMLAVRVVMFRQMYLYLTRNKVLQRNVLILGAGENGRKVAVNLFLHDYTGLRVVGFLDDDLRPGTPVFNGAAVLGNTSALSECVKEHGVEEILICYEKIDHTKLIETMEKTVSLNVIVKIASPLYEIIPLRRAIEHYGSIPVISVFQSEISPKKELYKRVFDVVLASLALILLMPILAAILVLIKTTSHGPLLFKQIRIGKNGKEFKLYKFRSMAVGAENDTERERQMAAFIRDKKKFDPNAITSTKIVNTTRVTSVGKWLRLLSLDELPQLLNVLKGEMSLVGPRPCLPYEWNQYEEWHKRRLSVLPGLTGMWQVSGRSVVGFEDMVILDLHYIQTASIMLDLRVIMKTIPVMLFGTGAK